MRLTHDGSHCHWTYQAEAGYRSFWRWPTRADVVFELIERGLTTARPVQLHATKCPTPHIEHD